MSPTMDMSKYLELFLSETKEHLSAIEELLARLAVAPEDEGTTHELYRRAHSIKGMAASMGYPRIAELAHGIEDVFDGIKTGAVRFVPEILGPVAGAFDHIERMIARVEAGEDAGDDLGPHLAAIAEATRTPALAAGASSPRATLMHLEVEVELATPAEIPSARAAVVLKRLESCGRLLRVSPTLDDLVSGTAPEHLTALLETARSITSVRSAIARITDVASVTVIPIAPAADPAPRASDAGVLSTETGAPSTEAGAPHTVGLPANVRVPAAALDRFLDTIGDFVVQRTRIDARLRGKIDRETDLALDGLLKLTRRLHADVMVLRMMPFDTIAYRFVRSVRDLSNSQRKKVSLRMTGREVRLDRSMLDELIDPINHILRNAIDHGIESPEERRAAGKPEVGVIGITLERAGDAVTVRIEDDGRGMDAERIKRAALDRGLVRAERLDALSPSEILMLATIPGISTASRITDLSGRGIGMDVVRTRVEALGGRLSLTSTAGSGTVVAMRLPLTIAVVPAFIVEAAGRPWAVPVSAVSQTLQVAPGEIRHAFGTAMIALRDGEARVVDLAAALAVGDATDGASRIRHALLVRDSERSVVFLVDRIVRRREVVVKALRQPLEELRAYSGATLLEDGRIALILDLPNLASV